MNEKFYLESDISEICQNLKKYSKFISGKKFLISGANGFLGKYFIKTLITMNKSLSKKIKITAIDIKFDKCEIYLDKNVKKIKKDINKIDKLNFKSDYVLHAAGIPSPKHYYNKPIEAIFTSITGTKKLLEYSKKNKSKFIFFSSSEIYGNPDKKNIPTKETYNGNVSCIEDRSCYDEGKRVGETLCYFFKIKQKLNISIFRPFNVYGSGQSNQFVISSIFDQINRGLTEIKIQNPYPKRDFIYIKDVSEAVSLAIKNDVCNEVFNLCSGTNYSIREVCEIIKSISQENIEFIFNENFERKGDVSITLGNYSKISSALGWEPKYSLERGINEIYSSK